MPRAKRNDVPDGGGDDGPGRAEPSRTYGPADGDDVRRRTPGEWGYARTRRRATFRLGVITGVRGDRLLLFASFADYDTLRSRVQTGAVTVEPAGPVCTSSRRLASVRTSCTLEENGWTTRRWREKEGKRNV